MLLWLSSVCWVIKLNTLKWDILTTGVAVYFQSKLRKLKLQTYQSISPAKVREKSPSKVDNRENGVWREGKFPSPGEDAAQKRRRTTFSDIIILDDKNSHNQVMGLVTSHDSYDSQGKKYYKKKR